MSKISLQALKKVRRKLNFQGNLRKSNCAWKGIGV